MGKFTGIFTVRMKVFAALALALLCGFAKCEGETPVADAAPVAAEAVKPVEDVPAAVAEDAPVEEEADEEEAEDEEAEDEEDDVEDVEEEDEEEEDEDEEEDNDAVEEQDDGSDVYIYNFTNSNGKKPH